MIPQLVFLLILSLASSSIQDKSGNIVELKAKDEDSAKASIKEASIRHGWDGKTARTAYGRLMVGLARVPTPGEVSSALESLTKDRNSGINTKAFRALNQAAEKALSTSSLRLSPDAKDLSELGLMRGDRSVCLIRLLRDVMRRGLPYLGQQRGLTLNLTLTLFEGVPGDVVEAGVQNGGRNSESKPDSKPKPNPK